MFATQILPQENAKDESHKEQEMGVVGFINVENKSFEIKKGENKIGRDPSICSVVLESFTVSKLHAIIESEGVDDTFIYDVGSTNQTKLGKKCLKPHYRYKIDDGAMITFGNVVSKFNIFKNVGKKTYLEITPPDSDEPFDIFEVPTQGNLIHVQESQKLTEFEKLPDNFKTFKIPEPQFLEERHKSSLQISQNSLSKKGQCQSEKFKDIVKVGGFQYDDSNIFNLSTQDQILQPVIDIEDKTNEWNKILQKNKQDECYNNEEILNLTSSVAKEDTENNKAKVNDLNLETMKEQLKFTSSNVDPNFNTNVSEFVDSQCNTQEFIQNSRPDPKESFPLDKANKISELSTIKETEFKYNQEKNINIQAVKNSFINNENENCTKEFPKQMQKDSKLLVDESSVDDTESYLEVSLQSSSQRNKSDDFICTQLFENQEIGVAEGTKENWKNPLETHEAPVEFVEERVNTFSCKSSSNVDNFSSLGRGEECEDFVATQIFKESLKCTENEEKEIWCLENSPDLLSPHCSEQILEDYESTQVLKEVDWGNIKKKVVDSDCKEGKSTFSDINIKKEKDEIIGSSKLGISAFPSKFLNNSSDETESDLEIIYSEESTESFKSNFSYKQDEEGFEVLEKKKFCNVSSQVENIDTVEINDSQSSYVFIIEENLVEGTIKNEPSSNPSNGDEENTVEFRLEKNDKDSSEISKTKTGEKQKESKDSTDDEDSKSGISAPAGDSNYEDSDASDYILTQALSKETIFQKIEKSASNVNTENMANATKIGDPCTVYNKSEPNKNVKRAKKVEASMKRIRNSEDEINCSPSKKYKLLNKAKVSEINEFSVKNKETQSGSRRKSYNRTDSKKKNSSRKSSISIENTLLNEKQKEQAENANQKPKNVNTPNRRLRNKHEKRFSKWETSKNEFHGRSSRMQVAFTGFESETLDEIISELGGEKTWESAGGDVLVTDRVRRTVKFLCAVNAGIPIVSPEWLLASRKEKRFLDPWDHILKDDNSEAKWDFALKFSLYKSKKKKLFEGFIVFATKSTKPPPEDLSDIVKSGGGKMIFKRPKTWTKKTIIVSCVEDKDCWPSPKLKHVIIVHYECILIGVLRQKLDFDFYKLR